MLDLLLAGIASSFQPQNLWIIVVGVIIGMIVGAAPGMGPTMGMAVTLPFALRLTPEQGIFLFVGILVGSQFGNSIPAVLIRVPGTTSALLTVVEGYPFQQRGEGGRALIICLLASLVGQTISILAFILFVIPISQIAVKFLFPEIFALAIFGLLTAIGLLGRNPIKGFVAVIIGLLLATIGPDPITSFARFGFGYPELETGLGEIPFIVGILAFREVFSQVAAPVETDSRVVNRLQIKWPSLGDIREAGWPTILGSIVGTIIGALPGAGGTVATFVTYQIVRTISRKKHLFGKGSLEALAAVDSSNNAAVGGELIPTLGLGIPGAASMVVIIAALQAQGIIPGPMILESRPALLYATFGGLLASTIILAVIGYLAIWPSVYVSRLSQSAVTVATMVLVIIGVYALEWSLFDVWVCIAAGFLGYIMTRYDYPVAPAALAFILGDLIESNFRRGLVMTGSLGGFVSRPGTAALLLAAILILVAVPVLSRWLGRRTRDETDLSASSAKA